MQGRIERTSCHNTRVPGGCHCRCARRCRGQRQDQGWVEDTATPIDYQTRNVDMDEYECHYSEGYWALEKLASDLVSGAACQGKWKMITKEHTRRLRPAL